MPTLSSVHVHPVKSLRALDQESAVVEPWGLSGDRRWMLVDAEGRFVSQREDPRLAMIAAAPDGESGSGLVVNSPPRLNDAGAPPVEPGIEPLRVSAPDPERGGRLVPVRVHGDSFEATEAAKEAHAWFSTLLGTDLRLVHLDDPLRRPANPEYAGPGRTVSMADGYPLLLTTTGSLTELNRLLAADHPEDPERTGRGSALPMNRFRPNLVVDGTAAWAEDDWRRVRVGEVEFRVVKPCGRCVITTTDQATGERRGPEPLRALARHHRRGKNLVFGQNLVPELPEGHDPDDPSAARLGTVRVGDPVEVLG